MPLHRVGMFLAICLQNDELRTVVPERNLGFVTVLVEVARIASDGTCETCGGRLAVVILVLPDECHRVALLLNIDGRRVLRSGLALRLIDLPVTCEVGRRRA